MLTSWGLTPATATASRAFALSARPWCRAAMPTGKLVPMRAWVAAGAGVDGVGWRQGAGGSASRREHSVRSPKAGCCGPVCAVWAKPCASTFAL